MSNLFRFSFFLSNPLFSLNLAILRKLIKLIFQINNFFLIMKICKHSSESEVKNERFLWSVLASFVFAWRRAFDSFRKLKSLWFYEALSKWVEKDFPGYSYFIIQSVCSMIRALFMTFIISTLLSLLFAFSSF